MHVGSREHCKLYCGGVYVLWRVAKAVETDERPLAWRKVTLRRRYGRKMPTVSGGAQMRPIARTPRGSGKIWTGCRLTAARDFRGTLRNRGAIARVGFPVTSAVPRFDRPLFLQQATPPARAAPARARAFTATTTPTAGRAPQS